MDIRDWLALGGLAMMGVGLYFVYPPLSLIVPGAVITQQAIYGHTRQTSGK